jgi:hypothetical protein
MEAGESEYSELLKACNLQKNRNTKNATTSKIAVNWNVSGTQDFYIVCLGKG